MDCLLEAVEWLLITKSVHSNSGGRDDAFAFQRAFLMARVQLHECIRLLLVTHKVGIYIYIYILPEFIAFSFLVLLSRIPLVPAFM